MAAALFPDNVAGQIVWVQLLCSMNTVVPAASAPNFTHNQISPAYMQTSARVLPTTFCIMNIGDEYANAPQVVRRRGILVLVPNKSLVYFTLNI